MNRHHRFVGKLENSGQKRHLNVVFMQLRAVCYGSGKQKNPKNYSNIRHARLDCSFPTEVANNLDERWVQSVDSFVMANVVTSSVLGQNPKFHLRKEERSNSCSFSALQHHHPTWSAPQEDKD